MFVGKKLFQSPIFFYCSCIVIFALSIFLRSIIDIGADTGVYLDLGKKIFLGKKYYYDFFESNFPLSFYFYAAQYFISLKTNISPIILSEIFINLLTILSIFWSAKILQKTIIFENKAHYHLIIISYFLGFFLRPDALPNGEFGTKTSLVLILLYPYLSYSFARIEALDVKNLIGRGILMGLIPCLKPQYLILILPLETYRFFKLKNLKFFFEIDKLVMALVGSSILLLMVKFTPEYFEFIPSMWRDIYLAYSDPKIFMNNFWHRLAAVTQFIFIFLIFARKKFTEDDLILTILFCSSALLIILENIGTIDQIVVFYAVATICFLKFTFDLFENQENLIGKNKFVIFAMILLPISDMEILPAAFLGVGGFINLWWLLALFHIFYYPREGRSRFLLLVLVIGAGFLAFVVFEYFGPWSYVAFNLSVLLAVLLIFEGKKSANDFSAFSIFTIFASISTLLYLYVHSIAVFTENVRYASPSKMSDMVVYYSKKYAPNNDESFLVSSTMIAHQFPFVNYLEKDNPHKFHVLAIQAELGKSGSKLMFTNKNPESIFTYSYLFDDAIQAVKNPKIKVLFFNNSGALVKDDRCLISNLEYYLLNPDFRKNFLQNFHFENHVVISEKKKILKKINFITGEKSTIFDSVKPSEKQIFYDFEVYVRN